MDDFIKNIGKVFEREEVTTSVETKSEEPVVTTQDENKDEGATGTEENYEVVPPHNQETPEQGGTDSEAEDDKNYDSDGSEWDNINTVIKMMYTGCGILLAGMMVRDYGLVVPLTLTACAGGMGYLATMDKYDLVYGYGVVRQKMDHLLEFFHSAFQTEQEIENHAPESDEDNIMMLQFKPEVQENEEADDNEPLLTWTQDSVIENSLIYMITRENRRGTLKIRFKTGQTRTIILNA